MKVQRTPPTKLREMGYRFSEKSGGWFKVSQEFLRLEAEALAAFQQKYEEYKLNDWLYFKANPARRLGRLGEKNPKRNPCHHKGLSAVPRP
jgi:hypothetical protein